MNAGPDKTLASPSTTTLTGTATDDGNPRPPGQLTLTWSLVSGPAAVTFSAPHALTTNATFSVAGTYTIRLSASDGEATSSDDVIVIVNAAGGSGTGLLAQYFNDAGNATYFTALKLTRTDHTIDFNWGSAAPNSAVQADNFSVRWSGQVLAPAAGTYTFTTLSDDGVRLYVNGRLVIDNWTDHVAVQNSGTIALAANQKYDVRLDYYERGGDATIQLSWAYPGQTSQVVPQSRLFPAAVVNQPPAVAAGPDQTITLPSAASLTGVARDDGLPNQKLTIKWSKISGREDSSGGTVSFSNAKALVTTATFGADGIYVLRLTVSDGAVTVSNDVTITVNPAPGPGLIGRYYNDPGTGAHFATLVLTRVDPTVYFSWGTTSPAGAVTVDNFSVRWTGSIQAPVTGTFQFTTLSDDGVRLWINGKLLIDNWTDHPATTNTSAGITLTAGVKYPITLEYYEKAGAAIMRLQWSYPGQGAQAIPRSRLFH